MAYFVPTLERDILIGWNNDIPSIPSPPLPKVCFSTVLLFIYARVQVHIWIYHGQVIVVTRTVDNTDAMFI
jgi:hypothetical protein